MAEEQKSGGWWDSFSFSHPIDSTMGWAKRKALSFIGIPDSVSSLVGGDDKDESKKASGSIMDSIKQKFESIMGGDDKDAKPGEDKGWFGGLFKNMSMGKGLLMGAAALFGIFILGKNLLGGLFGGDDDDEKKKSKEEDQDWTIGSVLWAGLKSGLAAVGVAMVAKMFGAKESPKDLMETFTSGFLTGAFRNATTHGKGGGFETGIAVGVNTLAVNAIADKIGAKSPFAKMFMSAALGEIEALAIGGTGSEPKVRAPAAAAPAPA
jgi:hypothetical protein